MALQDLFLLWFFILYRCKCLAHTTFRLSKHVVFEMSI